MARNKYDGKTRYFLTPAGKEKAAHHSDFATIFRYFEKGFVEQKITVDVTPNPNIPGKVLKFKRMESMPAPEGEALEELRAKAAVQESLTAARLGLPAPKRRKPRAKSTPDEK